MTTQSQALIQSQETATKWLMLACLAFAPLIAIAGYVLPAASVAPGAAAAAFAVLSVFGWKTGGAIGRQMVGLGIVGQAIAFVAALADTGWQIDAHFSFLVALAAMISLADITVILVSTVAIVIHHLGLGLLFPAFVFPSTEIWTNVARAVFHAGMVVLLDIALILAILNRQKLDRANLASLQDAQDHASASASAKAQAEAAQKTSEAEASRAAAAQAQAEQAVRDLSQAQQAQAAADREARATEARVADERAQRMREQNAVVAALQDGLSRLAAGDITGQIATPFPDDYENLRNDYNRALLQLGAILQDVGDQTTSLRDQVAA